jgi:hypothetical protein
MEWICGEIEGQMCGYNPSPTSTRDQSERMSGLSRISGIRSKIERSKKHIGDLDVLIRRFCDAEPYALSVKDYPEIAHVAIQVSKVNPIPTELALMIGDCIHNLRSALDHLACRLVEAGGGTPTRHTYFPICYGPKGAQQYRSSVGQGEIGKMRRGASEVLLNVQPYITGDDTLWHIHELDRIDKHRLILTAVIAVRAFGINALDRTIWFDVRPGILVVGYEVFRTPATTYHREAEKGFKLGLDVTFGQSEIISGKPVLETLNHMADFVDGIITSFEPFLV